MNFSVRAAKHDDLDTLIEFTLEEANHAEGIDKYPDTVRKGIEAALDDPSLARYWVLENQDGELLGSVSVLKEWSNWNAGHYWWIQSMFITPEYRGKRLMKHLMDKVREVANSENALDIRLHVHQDNLRAKKAYLREGFTNAPYEIMTMEIN